MGLMGSRRVLLTPSAPVPTIDLNFLTGALPSPVTTFTRASAGWYFNSAGTLTSAATNTPRFEAGGLLVEEARTNLFLNSAVGVTQSVTVTATAYTLSFYGTGTITLTGTSTAGPLVGTGASNRVTLTFTPTAGSLTLTVSGSATNVSLEAGSYVTSPIVTVGAAVTRAADVCNLTLGSWYNAAAGTLVVEFQTAASGTNLAAQISDNSYNNRILAGFDSTAFVGIAIVGGSTTLAPTSKPARTTAVAKIAFAWATDSSNLAGNGTLAAADVSGAVPTGQTRLDIGSDHGGANRLTGYVRRIRYWPARLPNAVLQSLTA